MVKLIIQRIVYKLTSARFLITLGVVGTLLYLVVSHEEIPNWFVATSTMIIKGYFDRDFTISPKDYNTSDDTQLNG